MNKYKKPILAYDVLNVEIDDEFREIIEKFSEKELTPVEMDLKVRIERVLYVLNRTLAIARVMIYMPTYFKNDAEFLKRSFQSEEVTFILKLANKYEHMFNIGPCVNRTRFPTYTDMLDNINLNRMPAKQLKYGAAPTNLSNPHCNQMINMLFNNGCVRQLAMGPKRKTVDKSLEEFYLTLIELKAMVKEMIMESGEEELAKNKELRQAYKLNVLVIASNKELEERLEKQRHEFKEQLDKKTATLTMYHKKMQEIKEDFQLQTETVLAESEKVMMNRTMISEERQVELAEEAKKVTKDFEQLMEDHLTTEKLSRSKRFKAETQLQNWVSKYDQDMGERQAEYEVIKASYDKEKEEMEALQDLFDEQEEEYEILMAEKKEEEDRLYYEMAYVFLCNRSAKIIQRAWREYIARKKARRKGKKGKGSRQSGAEKKASEGGTRDEDPNALLLEKTKKFKTEVFEDLEDRESDAFQKKSIVVEL